MSEADSSRTSRGSQDSDPLLSQSSTLNWLDLAAAPQVGTFSPPNHTQSWFVVSAWLLLTEAKKTRSWQGGRWKWPAGGVAIQGVPPTKLPARAAQEDHVNDVKEKGFSFLCLFSQGSQHEFGFLFTFLPPTLAQSRYGFLFNPF